METDCEDARSFQEVRDEAGALCCARVTLTELLHPNYRFLQLSAKEGSFVEGAMEREHLLSSMQFHYMTVLDEIKIPEWPISRWRAIKFNGLVLNRRCDGIKESFKAVVVVAECDRTKMPGWVLSNVAQGNKLDWAPVLVGYDIGYDSWVFDRIFTFTYVRLKCGVFDFSPVNVKVEWEC